MSFADLCLIYKKVSMHVVMLNEKENTLFTGLC